VNSTWRAWWRRGSAGAIDDASATVRLDIDTAVVTE